VSGAVGCKKPQGDPSQDSNPASIENVTGCEEGLARWLCRPKSEIFFAVRIDNDYCFYITRYVGNFGETDARHVADLYRNSKFTTQFPKFQPKKVGRNYILSSLKNSIEQSGEDTAYLKNKYLDVLKTELDYADKTPGKVNLNAKYVKKVGDVHIEGLANWTVQLMREAPPTSGRACPQPQDLQGSR
jgi:hypothetical protein